MHRLLFLLLLPILLMAQDHLLISEVFVPPSGESEKAFVEITNPTAQTFSSGEMYLANYNTYYQMVADQFPATNQFFVARFPNLTLNAGKVVVVALDGAGYFAAFGKRADFEIKGTDDQTPDLDVIRMGSNPALETVKGMMILFSWDGQSDLVKDVDYLPWGLLAFNATWMDKSGQQIDGPDADSDASAYLNDLPTNQQKAISSIPSGYSLQRDGVSEVEEIASDGNGLTGHNEASENFQQSFKTASPTPGSFSQVAGDGTGTAQLTPESVNAGELFDLTISFSTTETYELVSIELTLPSEFSWSQTTADLALSGDAFSAATVTVNQNQILIENASLNDQTGGTLLIKNLQAPSAEGSYPIEVKTATAAGNLTPIAIFPSISVQKKLTIADIQNNLSQYEGQVVTVEAVVTVGVNITRTDRCDAYVQDESGRGINLSDASTNYPELVRGNRLKITGTVTEYVSATTGDATTELINFTLELISTDNPVPAVPYLTCAEANNIDLEGTFIETAGVITDKAENIGGGTNITIDDGTTPLQLRIWDSSGLDLSAFNVGDTVSVRGVIDSYRQSAQVVVAYQQDIQKGAIKETVAGSGQVSVQPDSVGRAETVNLTFNLTGTVEDTIGQCALVIPSDWQWLQPGSESVQLSGVFSDASITISANEILLSDFTLTFQQSGSITVTGLTSPDADTVSVFKFKTGEPTGMLKEVTDPPRIIVGKGTNRSFISIAEARQKPVGARITVKGVITIGAGILRTNFTDAYLQDESGYGLNIYQGSGLDVRIKRGRLVIISGELDEYLGKKEIVNYTLTVLKDDVPIPAVRKLSTFEASTTEFEGSFVEIEGLISGIQYTGGGTNIYINDGSGEVTVRAWDTANLDLTEFEIGDYVLVRGVVGIYREAGQILLGYQEDILRPEMPEGQVYLKVPNRPFVPDQGEKLAIEYQAGSASSHVTLRIFDLSGRLIATLYDGDGLPFPIKKEWDGTDQLGQWVGLGTYLCHLEVVNNNNGKRTVKIAPIVVGTVLK
ncbi:OB-fold nucleic acid binding domain-containing protein [Caldithrix abyssi]